MSKRRAKSKKSGGALAGGDLLTWVLLLGVGGVAAFKVAEEVRELQAAHKAAASTPATAPTTTTAPNLPTTTAPTTAAPVPTVAAPIPTTAPAATVPTVAAPSPTVPAFVAPTQTTRLQDLVKQIQAAENGGVYVPRLFPFGWVKSGGPSTQPVGPEAM